MSARDPRSLRRGWLTTPSRLFAIQLLCCAMGLAATAQARPYDPQNDDEIVADLPSATTEAVRRARALHALLARAPTQLDLAVKTAEADLDLARAESDPRYSGHAEAALAPWWGLQAPPPRVLLLRATIRQNRHDFDGALADLEQLVAADPRNPQAYLTRAVVRQVRGEFDDAGADCLMVERLAPGLAAHACRDSVGSLTGHAEDSFRDLKGAYDALAGDAGKPVALWTLTLLGEMAERLDRPSEADAYFRRALALGVKDGYLLAAYADFLLDRRRPAEVMALLGGETRVDPLLLRLALAEQQLDAPSLAAHVADLEQRFAAATLRGDQVHRREQARFTLALLNRPAAALELARANWQIQREPADLRVLLAAALAADPKSASPALAWLDKTRLEDCRIAPLIRELAGGRS